ncbi:MAG TPA: hypothetical protein VGF06_08915 [Terriglobales bacterium]
MTSVVNSARAHISKIEARRKQQIDIIERLTDAGQDPTEAVRILAILDRALEEMKLQLARLIPTEAELGAERKHHKDKKK